MRLHHRKTFVEVVPLAFTGAIEFGKGIHAGDHGSAEEAKDQEKPEKAIGGFEDCWLFHQYDCLVIVCSFDDTKVGVLPGGSHEQECVNGVRRFAYL